MNSLGHFTSWNLKSGNDHALDIQLAGDLPKSARTSRKLSRSAFVFLVFRRQGLGRSFGVRGEIVTVPAEKGDIRNLTNTTDVVERDPAWSPDGKSIAYLSDESGEYALHLRDQSGLGEVRKIDLGNPPTFYYSPTWSPDSKKIATRQTAEFLVRGPGEENARSRGTDTYTDRSSAPNGLVTDSRWIAYTKQLENHLHAVFVYSLEQVKITS